jgi:phenylacetic acid degradation operon negative regulatory protein
VLRLRVCGDVETNRAIAARAWPLAATRDAYTEFIQAFAPFRDAVQQNAPLSELDALVARTLLIHAYRRIVLRDPLLPPEILPTDWPGAEARALCGSIYRTLLPQSESWLDAHAIDETGAALLPNPEVYRRFQD